MSVRTLSPVRNNCLSFSSEISICEDTAMWNSWNNVISTWQRVYSFFTRRLKFCSQCIWKDVSWLELNCLWSFKYWLLFTVRLVEWSQKLSRKQFLLVGCENKCKYKWKSFKFYPFGKLLLKFIAFWFAILSKFSKKYFGNDRKIKTFLIWILDI